MERRSIYRALAAACLVAVAANPAVARVTSAGSVHSAPQPDTAILTGETPTIVQSGAATRVGVHPPSAQLSINLSLPLRNQAALDEFIANQASRGIYMTNAQFDATFGPDPQQVQSLLQWAATQGLQPQYVSGDNTLITLRGATGNVAAALHVSIDDYRAPDGTSFYSASRDPSVPAALGVQAISGLNNIPRWHVLHQALSPARFRSGGYFPSDFRTAYDVNGSDGTGQTIGFTLWGTSVANSDLSTFAGNTGDTAISQGTGPDQIEWIPVNGGSSATDALVETALDVESAHGIATHAHLKYWLGDEVCSGVPPQCGGTDVGLENGISAAANDPSVHVVSNSWGGGEAPSTSDPFTSTTASSFQHAVAVGTTFYFSSGDSGSNSGGTGLPSYPADSPYVVSVGGTHLNTTTSYGYTSESAWSGSGGGCSTVFARPSWQTGVGRATCSGRAEPDISADADPNTGAYVYVQGAAQQVGGTSLAAPLFAGMAAAADRYAAQNSLARIGWAAPKIYTLVNGSSYGTTYHDVTTGNNGFAAGVGWDQATGWGSIDWAHWVQAIVGTAGGATATPTNTPPPGATATNTPVPATATNTPVPATSTNTPAPGAGIANGGFESGSLSGWTTAIAQGSGNAEVAPQISSAQHHSGSYSALVGSASATEPSGDSCLYQNFSTGGGTFSASYLPFDPNGDTVTYDWQEGYIRPSGTSGCAEAGTQLFKVDANSQTWTAATTTLAAGAYQAYFNVHEDGYGDPTYMYVDDVSAPAGGGAGPTNTPVPATSTNTPAPATATNTPAPATATNTRTPVPATATNTPSGGFTNPVVNGGFESGSLSGWTAAGVGQGGQAIATTTLVHSGAYAARLGVPSGSEPNGDNCLYQNESFSGAHTLSVSYAPYDVNGDTITYDWQEGYFRPSGTSGCAEVGTRLFKIESNSQAWTAGNYGVTGPGQIYFNVRGDGYTDPSALYVDDISIH